MTRPKTDALAPAPRMAAVLEPITEAVQQWPGTLATARRDPFQAGNVVDGTTFYVGDDEVGHLHLNGEAHVATSLALKQALVARGLAKPLRWGGAAFPGWTEFSVRTAADAAHATWLFELNYQRLRGRPETELITAIATHQLIAQ